MGGQARRRPAGFARIVAVPESRRSAGLRSSPGGSGTGGAPCAPRPTLVTIVGRSPAGGWPGARASS